MTSQDQLLASGVGWLRAAVVEAVRRWCRLDVEVRARVPDEPVLFVANHGFGGIVDLNVFALQAALDEVAHGRPVISLTHSLAWTLGVGPLVEPVGARPAGPDVARRALADGYHVAVFPGGDLEASKPFWRRDTVSFSGGSGFARLAIDAGVPLVPVVTAGAGESLLVLSDGQRLARALRLKQLLRYRALPVTVSVPWGLNVGLVGLLPYLPLPSKLDTTVLPAVRPEPDETPQAFARRVERLMQDEMTALTAGRRLLLGRPDGRR